MKKAFLILSGLLFLAGCSGFQYLGFPNFLSPAQAQIIPDLSLPPADRGGMTAPVSSGGSFLAEIQPEDQLSSPSEPEVFCCFPETFSLIFSGLDDGRFSWPMVSPSNNGDGEVSPKIPPEKAEDNGSGEGSPPLSSPNPSEESVDRLREALALYEMEAISPTPSLREEAMQETLPRDQEAVKILSSIPSILNDNVKSFIDLFQTKADSYFTRSLARSQAYEGMMKKILREKNLPEELFYLALIESGYNPHAQSRAKATGIWQFMNRTGKRYGLKVDKWVDERRDPEKSTYAAAEYLKDLYEMFNCWYLAAAGYNAGEGKVLQAMKRAKSQDFWEISKHRYLKRETKQYVPMFLAAMIIAQDPEKYGFSNIAYHTPLEYEKVAVPPGTRLDRIARAAETNLEEIRALNPALRRDKTPPEGASFEIKLPPGKKEVFERNFSRVFKLDPRTARKHQIRRGDTLGQIAKKYRVDVQEICKGNEITPKTILRPGDTLLLPP